jgi:ribosomal protein S18 acetylase RimI-like enzyme
MPVRKATPEDFDAILDMCAEFWKHTQFREPFERDHTIKMVQLCYDFGLLAVAEDDEICGFVAAVKSPLLASTAAFMATELAWYVKPQKRGNIYGIQLIKLLESLCIEQEVAYLNLAFMETSMPVKVKKLYESLGYTLQETAYTKVLTGNGDNLRHNSGIDRCWNGRSINSIRS